VWQGAAARELGTYHQSKREMGGPPSCRHGLFTAPAQLLRKDAWCHACCVQGCTGGLASRQWYRGLIIRKLEVCVPARSLQNTAGRAVMGGGAYC